VKRQIRTLISNRDARLTGLGIKTLGGTYPTLSAGIIARSLQDYRPSEEAAVGVGKGRKQAAG